MRISDWSSDVCSSDLLKRLSLSHIKMLDELVAYIHSNGSRTVRSDLVYLERSQALMDEIRLVVDRIVVDTQRQNQAKRQLLQKQMLIKHGGATCWYRGCQYV